MAVLHSQMRRHMIKSGQKVAKMSTSETRYCINFLKALQKFEITGYICPPSRSLIIYIYTHLIDLFHVFMRMRQTFQVSLESPISWRDYS